MFFKSPGRKPRSFPIGRTGRAHATGCAISLCEEDERAYLGDIEKLTRRKIKIVKDHPFPPSFQEIADHINTLLNVTDDAIEAHEEEVAKVSGAKDEQRTYRCPTCGHPLVYASDVCPNCTSKRQVMGRLFQFMMGRWPLFAAGTLLSILGVAVTLTPPFLTRLMVDNVLQQADLPQSARMSRLTTLLLIFLGLIIVRFVTQHFRIKIMGVFAARVLLDLRRTLYRALQRLSLSYYDREHTGRIMARVLNDTSGIQQFVVQGLQNIIVNGLMVVAIPVILYMENPFLATVALLPIPVVVMLGKLFSKKYRAVYRMIRRRFATLSASISESISGMRVVKSFAQEDREVRGFDAKLQDVYDGHVSAVRTRAMFGPESTPISRCPAVSARISVGRSKDSCSRPFETLSSGTS